MNDLPENTETNPCLSCGACCASFRCSFYWKEADDVTPNGVPLELTEELNDFRRFMKGTGYMNPHCVALVGEIGHNPRCSIYPRRPSTCRKFVPSYSEGKPEPECDEARRLHGLPPLGPQTWCQEPDDLPKPRRPRRGVPRRAA